MFKISWLDRSESASHAKVAMSPTRPAYVLWLLFLIPQVYSISKHPILIVVSYDAFRYNFFNTERLSYMEKVRHSGVYADYMINVFPTKTFPNHHSIATGLYAEVHGVVGNSYYDPEAKHKVKIGYDMFHYSDEVKPIWVSTLLLLLFLKGM